MSEKGNTAKNQQQ